jgi:AraC family transcriptional regulator
LYGNALRIEQGVKNLSLQRQTIAAVSDQLGFTTQGNFSRFFSQHTGITPSSFSRMVNLLDDPPPHVP